MSFTVKSFDQIISDMVAWIVANSPNITDLSPGSVIRSFCEGSALSIEEVYVSTYLGFQRYLNNIQESAFDFERKAGTKATTNVVFSRTGSSGNVTIPSGTRLKTASGLRFITTADISISDGDTDSDPVEAEAESVGTSYNVSSTTITVIEDQVAGVDSVTNPAAATGGVDRETDIAFKKRFQDYIEGLGRANLAGIRSAALSVEGITSVDVVEHFPPVSDVNATVYIDDGSSGGVSTALVADVQSVIDGDGTEENPGYRSAGVNVEVAKPAVVTQDIDVTLEVIGGVDVDQVESDVIDALTEYVNTLGVGNDIIYNELVTAVMNVYGIADSDVTTPSSNVTIASTQVGRVGTITILGI